MVKHPREVAEKITRMEWFFFLFVVGKNKKKCLFRIASSTCSMFKLICTDTQPCLYFIPRHCSVWLGRYPGQDGQAEQELKLSLVTLLLTTMTLDREPSRELPFCR